MHFQPSKNIKNWKLNLTLKIDHFQILAFFAKIFSKKIFFQNFFEKNFKFFFQRQLWFGLLKTSFKDFEFVFGAKVIYFSHWIQIWRNFWRARTSARAAEWNKFPPSRAKNESKWCNFNVLILSTITPLLQTIILRIRIWNYREIFILIDSKS